MVVEPVGGSAWLSGARCCMSLIRRAQGDRRSEHRHPVVVNCLSIAKTTTMTVASTMICGIRCLLSSMSFQRLDFSNAWWLTRCTARLQHDSAFFQELMEEPTSYYRLTPGRAHPVVDGSSSSSANSSRSTLDISPTKGSSASRSPNSPPSSQRTTFRRSSTTAHDAYSMGIPEGTGHRLLAQRGAGRGIFKAISLSNLREIRSHHKVHDGSPHRVPFHTRLSDPASRAQPVSSKRLNHLPSSCYATPQFPSAHPPTPLSPTTSSTVHKPSRLCQASVDYSNGAPPLPTPPPSSSPAPPKLTERSNGMFLRPVTCSYHPGSTRSVPPLVLSGSPNLSPTHNQKLPDKALPLNPQLPSPNIPLLSAKPLRVRSPTHRSNPMEMRIASQPLAKASVSPPQSLQIDPTVQPIPCEAGIFSPTLPVRSHDEHIEEVLDELCLSVLPDAPRTAPPSSTIPGRLVPSPKPASSASKFAGQVPHGLADLDALAALLPSGGEGTKYDSRPTGNETDKVHT